MGKKNIPQTTERAKKEAARADALNRDSAKRNTGVYRKFFVHRCDGTDQPGKKHADCQYFVIDVTHDEFAPAALKAYAKACAKKYPQLSKDLAMAAITRVMDYSPTPPELA